MVRSGEAQRRVSWLCSDVKRHKLVSEYFSWAGGAWQREPAGVSASSVVAVVSADQENPGISVWLVVDASATW